MLLIRNCHLLDPYTETDAPREILIGDDGVIAAVAPEIAAPNGCPVLEAPKGATVSPGFVDTHVHFRDPGQTQKETLHTGALAAARGGYTTVVCMANTVPTVDNAETLSDILRRAEAESELVEIRQTCAITRGLGGTELTDFDALRAAGAVGFTDDGINLSSAALARSAMEQAAASGVLLSFHEEDPSLVPSPGVNFGAAAAAQFGVPGARAESESCMVGRDIALALATGAKVVFQHISCKESVALIRAGKALGASIYAEATPHHLTLTEDAVATYGTLARMNPPLRRADDRQALVNGLCDGTIDLVATDHAPHTAAEKARPFAQAPSGITGLETAFSVLNTFLVQKGLLSPMTLLTRMSRTPAELYGFTGRAVRPGNRAALVLLDWDSPMVYDAYCSKSANTPFTGMPLRGRVLGTVLGDRSVRVTP